MGVGMVLGLIVLCCIYFNNVFNTGYLPINSNRVFANDGSHYHVAKIIDSVSVALIVMIGGLPFSATCIQC
jgi:hypothetical protein